MARKKPGPHPENPLEIEVKARVDKKTFEQLQYCQDRLNVNRSETIRKSIKTLYEKLKKLKKEAASIPEDNHHFPKQAHPPISSMHRHKRIEHTRPALVKFPLSDFFALARR